MCCSCAAVLSHVNFGFIILLLAVAVIPPFSTYPKRRVFLVPSFRTRAESHLFPPQTEGIGSCSALPNHLLTPPPHTRWKQGQHAHTRITNVSHGQHACVGGEKEEKLMSINNLRCVKLTFWDNGEQSLYNIQKMTLAALPCLSLDCGFQNSQAKEISFVMPPF